MATTQPLPAWPRLGRFLDALRGALPTRKHKDPSGSHSKPRAARQPTQTLAATRVPSTRHNQLPTPENVQATAAPCAGTRLECNSERTRRSSCDPSPRRSSRRLSMERHNTAHRLGILQSLFLLRPLSSPTTSVTIGPTLSLPEPPTLASPERRRSLSRLASPDPTAVHPCKQASSPLPLYTVHPHTQHAAAESTDNDNDSSCCSTSCSNLCPTPCSSDSSATATSATTSCNTLPSWCSSVAGSSNRSRSAAKDAPTIAQALTTLLPSSNNPTTPTHGPCNTGAMRAEQGLHSPDRQQGLQSLDGRTLRLLGDNVLLHMAPALPAGMARESWRLGEYQLVRKLYKGYASSVYKAVCLHSGVPVCVKAYNLNVSDFLRHQLLREVQIHASLMHKNVVSMYAVFKEGDFLVIVMEYMRGGDLGRMMRKVHGRMLERQAAEVVVRPLLGALAALHASHIVHRDIKPANLLLSENWDLKVADFGVAVDLARERAVTRTGTPDYMAPEVQRCPLKRGPLDNKDKAELAYGIAADVWSVGALTYELLVGFPPFSSQARSAPAPTQSPAAVTGVGQGNIGKLDQEDSELAYPEGVTGPARDFIAACLRPQPCDRPTARELLAHPWLSLCTAIKRTGSVPDMPFKHTAVPTCERQAPMASAAAQ